MQCVNVYALFVLFSPQIYRPIKMAQVALKSFVLYSEQVFMNENVLVNHSIFTIITETAFISLFLANVCECTQQKIVQ